MAQVVAFLDITLVRDIDAGFALDGFHHHGADLVTFLFEHFPEGFGVIVRDPDETGRERTVVVVAVRVVRHRDDGDGAAVEVALADDDQGLVFGNALDDISPAAGQLQGRLDRFRARVHREEFVVAEEFGGKFLIRTEAVVVEGTRGQAQVLGLVAEGLDDLRMAMSLVDGGIGREEVEIAFAVDIPDKCTLSFGKDHGQRMIVMSTVPIFQIDVLLSVGGDSHSFLFVVSFNSTKLQIISQDSESFSTKMSDTASGPLDW